jgi:hypothetical protein
MTVKKAAQAQLREIARDLQGTKYRLMGVHASVPPSPSESDPQAEVDVTTDPVAHIHGYLDTLRGELESLIKGVLEAAGSTRDEDE